MLSMIRESYHQIMLKPVYWMIANTDKNTRWVKIMVEKSGYKWLNGGGKRDWGARCRRKDRKSIQIHVVEHMV